MVMVMADQTLPNPGTAWVHYGQIYLADGDGDMADFETLRTSGVGVVGVEPGAAILLTGLHTGHVGFAVVVAAEDPGADLDGYEDVVEVSFESRDGTATLVEWAGGGAHELPPLPGGAGTYRLRYHSRNTDAAQESPPALEEGSEPVDEYLLQIWPAPPAPGEVVKATSRHLAYCLSPRRDFSHRRRMTVWPAGPLLQRKVSARTAA